MRVPILQLRGMMDGWVAAGTSFDVLYDGQVVAGSYLTKDGLRWATCRGFSLPSPDKRRAVPVCETCGQEVCS